MEFTDDDELADDEEVPESGSETNLESNDPAPWFWRGRRRRRQPPPRPKPRPKPKPVSCKKVCPGYRVCLEIGGTKEACNSVKGKCSC